MLGGREGRILPGAVASARVPSEMTVLYDEIRVLIDAPSGADGPTLAVIEDTLTAGYARALELEAERMRLERRLGELAANGKPDSDEVAWLGERLTAADGDLTRLRSLLGRLRDRARRLRAGS